MVTAIDRSKTANILLVEDDEGDVILTKEGFAETGLAINLEHVDNGEECLKYLRRQAPYENAMRPDLVILDINMPIMDGREVLKAINEDDDLRNLPVIILTTSENDRDILDMYNMRCSSYISKPINFDDFRDVIKKFTEYWFSLVILPHEHIARSH